jgi:dynein heavy chain
VLIDPQGQGLAWLKRREEARGLRVTSLSDKFLRGALEDCLSAGRSLVIENVEEEVDPLLDPVLEKRVVRKGRSATLQLADKEVDFDDGFGLFLTTRLPNPHYSPELSAKVTVIDFTVTQTGLEDQLLNRLILKEKYELEEQRKALVEEVTAYKRKIKQLEDDLLFRLSNSTGNLLDDTELIDVLAVTKRTAQEVNERLATASETNKKITEACEEFRPVARRATLIYFLIAEFSTVNCMYQTSLAQFMELYEAAIDRAEQAAMPSKRIHNIVEYLTYSVYLYVQRGLFERHKLIFALMLANKVGLSAGTLDPDALSVFLRGAGSLDISTARKKPREWIPDVAWLNVLALSSLPAFTTLPDVLAKSEAAWRAWYDLEAPEKGRIPEFDGRLSKFERTMLVKALRPDRTLVTATDYIAEALGSRFVESVPVNLEAALAESRNRVPLICLLSPGADPTRLIEDLAKRKKVRVLGVSMGQGQEIIARKLMASATADGNWVLLQNTHLGLGYLSEVENFLLKAEDIHDDFRLWITAEPHPAFPIGLLQMGIKITNEAPVGLRAGLRASYAWVTQDMLDAVPRHEWRQLLFVQCFLHSIVQERRKFGPIGWNVPYEFNQGDLSACTQFLQNHLTDMDAKKAAAPTWATVQYMISSIQYGGRITDDFDQLLMDTFAAKYFNPAVLAKGFELYPGYRVLDGSDIAAVRADIERLPGTDSPEIFGMHPNADLTYRTLTVQAAIDTIVETMPKTRSSGLGLSREEVVDKLCEDLLAKMPPAFDGELMKEKLRKLPGGAMQPLTIHLRQELDRLNVILELATRTLSSLRLAIAGTVALSGDLIQALDSLFDGRIPSLWLKKSWEAASLGSWFTGLLARHAQLEKWLLNGRPKAFWLTGFFNPQGFLTAMKQEVSRRHAADKWSLDDVVMTSEVLHPPRDVEGLREEPREGVYIYGLYLDGCSWSAKENRLVDSEPKKLFSPLPVLYVTGVLAKDRKAGGVYAAPTYSVRRRTGANFITTFDLRVDERDPATKWVLRGTCLLASVD